jgi:hypothetical protein
MGRRRIHADDAAKSQAYRDRLREERLQTRKALAQAERRAEKAEVTIRELRARLARRAK